MFHFPSDLEWENVPDQNNTLAKFFFTRQDQKPIIPEERHSFHTCGYTLPPQGGFISVPDQQPSSKASRGQQSSLLNTTYAGNQIYTFLERSPFVPNPVAQNVQVNCVVPGSARLMDEKCYDPAAVSCELAPQSPPVECRQLRSPTMHCGLSAADVVYPDMSGYFIFPQHEMTTKFSGVSPSQCFGKGVLLPKSEHIKRNSQQAHWNAFQVLPANNRPTSGLQAVSRPVLQMPRQTMPSEYWLVRSDSVVVEENSAFYIELETINGTQMRAPAARFETVYQSALQDNQTTPAAMRAAWQIRKVKGKPLVVYDGPCLAGVNKARKSSLFAPFISMYHGQYCVMLVDDTDARGVPKLRPLRSSPYLPETISNREAGWFLEAMLNRDWSINIEDIMDRMLSNIRLDLSTYNRWRRRDRAIYDFEDHARPRH